MMEEQLKRSGGQQHFSVGFGMGVGKLKLGALVNEILSLLANDFPRTEYDLIAHSSREEIHIYIPQWGMRCRFLPRSQSLYLIDILDTQSCPYSLNGVLIFQKNHKTTFKSLQKVLGPSFPGKFIADGFYLLEFDGVGLLFSIPTQFQDLYSDGSSLPLELPDGTSPVLNRVYICPSDYRLLSKSPYRDLAPTRVFVDLDLTKPEGLRLRISLGDNRESLLSLGMCPQEVLSNIGSPDFSSAHPKSDLFSQHFEYYSLGIAVYFSAQHRVSQVVMYSNMPCHPDFGRFSRCDYLVSFSGQSEEGTNDDGSGSISPDTPWIEAEDTLASWLATHYERTGREELPPPAPAAIKPPPAGCPFASTKLFGYSELNLVVEVREESEIASIAVMTL